MMAILSTQFSTPRPGPRIDRSTTAELPPYARELAAFHSAFSGELKNLIGGLPLSPEMRVLDVGCGDAFYLDLLAERLQHPGGVVGLDVNSAYLEVAHQRMRNHRERCEVRLVQGSLHDLPLDDTSCDLVWCAQSLYSLPEPVSALRQMATAVRPGGFVVVLENDTMHQLLLPWPNQLELALRVAEFEALTAESTSWDRYYVGRRLPAVLAEAGVEPLGFSTQCIDRRVPLGPDLETFLQAYFARLSERVAPYLARNDAREFERIIDPAHDAYLFRQPYLTLSWMNILAWGRCLPGTSQN
jgi:ubiquinone/menaquinone biosynthesis C-methylase UbiE